MTDRRQFFADQPTQPVQVVSRKKAETQQERLKRLKALADATGKRFVQVYLEDERRRRQNRH